MLRIMRLKIWVLVCFLTPALTGFGQSGPGGVGSSASVAVWLDASQLGLTNGDTVSTWSDLSGNSNDAVQGGSTVRPVFQTNQVNGLPSIAFDGTNDNLNIYLATELSNSDDISWFFVAATNFPAKAQTIISTNYSGGSAFNYKWGSLFRNTKNEDRIRNDAGGYSIRNSTLSGTYILRSNVMLGASTDAFTGFVNSTSQHTATLTSFSTNGHAKTSIGKNSHNSNWYLDGSIAEMIIHFISNFYVY